LTIAVAALLASASALATATGKERIKECIGDYSMAESQPDEVTSKYCACMDQKMGRNETMSVLEWEVTHATEAAACEQESGWKDE
jgi:hypothetical protein